MGTTKHLNEIKRWFEKYTSSFYTGNDPHNSFLLKVEHTFRVQKEMKELTDAVSLNHTDTQLALIIALLHDIGRFEQFKKYSTFLDLKSENHADLGINVLEEQKVLSSLSTHDQNIIFQAISYHNLIALPSAENDPKIILFTKLIRDADKLDIYRLVTMNYSRPRSSQSVAIGLGLPDEPKISDEVVEDIFQQENVKHYHLNTVNDFKILQMGWILDINFGYSYRKIRDKKFLDKIYQSLPQTHKTKRIHSFLKNILDERCQIQDTFLT